MQIHVVFTYINPTSKVVQNTLFPEIDRTKTVITLPL